MQTEFEDDTFITPEDYAKMCYQEEGKKHDELSKEFLSDLKVCHEVRNSIGFVIWFGFCACCLIYVMHGIVCSIILGVGIIIGYILLVLLINKSIERHNDEIKKEFSARSEILTREIRKKRDDYEKKINKELENKTKEYMDTPVVRECAQRAGMYFRDQISRANRGENVEKIQESYFVTVGRNRIDLPCKNVIFNEECYVCDFYKMGYKELDVVARGAVANIIAKKVAEYIRNFYPKDIGGGACKVKFNEPFIVKNEYPKTTTGYYWDSEKYYWLVRVEYEAINTRHKGSRR